MLFPGFVGFIVVPSLPAPASCLPFSSNSPSHDSSSSALPMIKGEHSLLNSVINVDLHRGDQFSTIASHFNFMLSLALSVGLHAEQLFWCALQKDTRGVPAISNHLPV